MISAGARLFLHWQCTLQWGYLCPRSWQAFEGLISCRSDRSLTSPFRSSLKCRDRHLDRTYPLLSLTQCPTSSGYLYLAPLLARQKVANVRSSFLIDDLVLYRIVNGCQRAEAPVSVSCNLF